MTTTQRSIMVGVFPEWEHARQAIEALKDQGFEPDAISIRSPALGAATSVCSRSPWWCLPPGQVLDHLAADLS